MPDFPRTATASEIWAYGERSLTDKAGFTISGEKQTLDALNDITADSVWDVVTRELTGITGTPRSDLLGEDADFEAGTGTRKVVLDNVPYFETPVEGSLVMDGDELPAVEKTDDKAGLLEGMINLTPMQAGDVVVIREYMQVLSTGAYAKYAEETYSGEQAIPIVQVLTRISTHDIKVTIQQTAGVDKTFEYSFVRRRKV